MDVMHDTVDIQFPRLIMKNYTKTCPIWGNTNFPLRKERLV